MHAQYRRRCLVDQSRVLFLFLPTAENRTEFGPAIAISELIHWYRCGHPRLNRSDLMIKVIRLGYDELRATYLATTR